MEGTIGVVTPWAANFAPLGWMFCQGQLLSIAEYSTVFALLGTTYGGDGVTTFALPNFSSRTAIGTGQGPGLTNRVLGQVFGTENNTITTQQMAQHTHALAVTAHIPANVNSAASATPQGNYPAISSSAIYNSQPTAGTFGTSLNAALTVSIAGSSVPVNNIQPVLCLNYIICTEGVFPSRG
jgi:microcystin-dependent protein